MSKSRDDFQSLEAYQAYLRIETAKSAVCVLLTKRDWKDHKEMCKEAIKIGQAFTEQLKLK